jgi:hypothetical protein
MVFTSLKKGGMEIQMAIHGIIRNDRLEGGGDFMRQLSLSLLPGRFAVCRLGPNEAIPDWVFSRSFCSITRTDEELSVILPEELVPSSWKAEKGWRCLKVLGPLDFSLTGVLASLSTPLAEAGVPILAMSTYDTDYLLVRNGDVDTAKEVLIEHGHRISP